MRLLYLHSGEIDSGMANAVQPLHMCCAFARLGLDVTLAVPGTDAGKVRECITELIGEMPQFDVKTFRRITIGGRSRCGDGVQAELLTTSKRFPSSN